ncbi:MAG: type II secretion system protein GspI [Cellvibrionales bacterium TMED148]|nr:type II secretion system protein GspI [Porticoccaceae bacterium]RPG89982.1 MAG: type II secretion system protein GspI [Cellvibrionales bacterium TMED148]
MSVVCQKERHIKAEISGFTLLEVVVALLILSMVLTSSIQLVHRYADQRIKMQDRISANQVAWNQLMERHQIVENWVPSNDVALLRAEGVDEESDRTWKWELKIEPAVGQNLFRHQVQVYLPNSADSEAKLAVFLVNRAY